MYDYLSSIDEISNEYDFEIIHLRSIRHKTEKDCVIKNLIYYGMTLDKLYDLYDDVCSFSTQITEKIRDNNY